MNRTAVLFLLLPMLSAFANPGTLAAQTPVFPTLAAGNGTTDDTAALQKAIDALPAYGVLDGQNKTYLTGSLFLKSRMTLQNFKFTTRPSSSGFTSPVTIDGIRTPVEEVTIVNVHVNGNRSRQTNLGPIEDGGRHGFRLVGKARRIWILNSSATYCASDGLEIFSGDGALSGDDNLLNFENIVVSNSTFNYNRRHGISGDSLRNVTFSQVAFSYNGLDLNGGATEGDRGARLTEGILYGAGVDIEGYGVGSGVDGLTFLNCTSQGNARYAIQFWEPTSPLAARYIPRRNIRIQNSTLKASVTPTHGGQVLEWSGPVANLDSGRPVYESITVTGSTLEGMIMIGAAAQVNLTGNIIRSPYPGYFGRAYRCTGLVVQQNDAQNKTIYAQ